MLSGKAQAATKPTALGSLLQASTYGATIPVIYGMTQSPILAIWAGNIRQGGSIKKLKQFLKGITSYVENIDFLLGHNPIMGVQQMWNNGSPIPLNFVSVELGGAGAASYSVADPNFYALIAVTLVTAYSGVAFNDYGGGGPQTLSGTYEVPCWNTLHAGPAWNNQQRYFPFTYRWQPSFGEIFYLDGQLSYPSPGIDATVKAYYSQLKAATSFLPPLQKEFLFFESELGSGPEYAEAKLVSQQIIYPMFAGVGSSNMDLGVAGVIPQLQAEVQGKWGIYPTGDGDFADMIEDVFRSGVAQAAIGDNLSSAAGFTQVEHGLSAYDFPGPVQNQIGAFVDPAPLLYSQYNTQGNFLVVIATSSGVGTLGISDTAGNTWTPVLASGLGCQVWWAQVQTSGPNTVTVSGLSFDSGAQVLEIAGVDSFDSSTVGTSPSVSQVTTNQQGFPAYIMSVAFWIDSGSFNHTPNIPLWKPLNAPNGVQNTNSAPGLSVGSQLTFSRIVKTPGTYEFTMPQPLFNPTSICSLAFKCATAPPTNPAPVGDFIDSYSLECVRQQCRANGLWGSLTMDSQQAASDWLTTLYQAADAAPVFMGFKLFSVPLSEVSAVGNGAIYYAPTACGPVANLSTETGDFLDKSGGAPITVKTAARVDQPNVLQMQCVNRSSNYNPSVVGQPDAASISLFGIRKADPVVNNAVQDVSIARNLLGIMVRKLQYGGDVYSFTLPAKWVLLSPMDLVTVTDPLVNINQIPVRLSSIAEQSDGSLECEAEPFVYGMYAPLPFNTDAPTPFQRNPTISIDPVNAPIIFEPVPGLIGSANQGQIWLVVSDPDPSYGGAQVYVSTDGGSSYNPAGNPIIGNGFQGVTVGDWPAANSPDTTNDLDVDLTESLEALQSYSVADEDNFLYPCYVQAGTGGGGGGAAPFVQGASEHVNSIAGMSLAFPSDNAAGNCIVVDGIFSEPFAGSAATFPGVTDSQNNLYTIVKISDEQNNFFAAVWVAYNIKAGPNTVFVTWDVPTFANQGMGLAIHEYTDILATSSPVDAVVYTGSPQPPLPSPHSLSATITTSASPDVLHTFMAASDPLGTIPFTDILGSTVREQNLDPGSGAGNNDDSSFTTFDVKVAGAKSFTQTCGIGGAALGFGFLFVLALKTTMGGGGGGSTTIPYELMTYAVANLTAANKYTLSATGGNHLNRGVFGAPELGVGVDHPSASPFALLPPNGQGILKLPLLPAYIGQTLYFKIIPLNTFGVASGDLTTATAYPYVVLGTSGAGAGGFLVNGQ